MPISCLSILLSACILLHSKLISYYWTATWFMLHYACLQYAASSPYESSEDAEMAAIMDEVRDACVSSQFEKLQAWGYVNV